MPEIILKQKISNEFISDCNYKALGEWIIDYLLYFECDIKQHDISDEYEITIQVKKK